MKVFHGDIVTCDKKDNVFRYLVEDDGNILFVGNDLPGEFGTYEAIELGDRALLPSFGDGHLHFSNWALLSSTYDVRDAKNLQEVGEAVKEYAERDKKDDKRR